MTDESKLTLNLEALKETRLMFRDDEINQMLLSMSNGVNTYVFGSSGIGKTTAVKNAIEKFNDTKNKAIYVSCSTYHTEFSILEEIIDRINAMFTQKIFIQTRCNSDLIRRLKKDRENKYPNLKVVALDHVESLKEPNIVDSLMETGFTLILVSNEQKAVNKLNGHSQSFIANTIKFRDYSQEEIVKILNTKARHLLGEGNYKQSLVKKIAELCNGNIGYGVSLLMASIARAMSLKKACVDETDLPEIQKEEELSFDEKIIIEILKEERSVQGGKLYLMYCERTRFPKAERTFRNYMQHLCERNLVRAIGTNKGRVYELNGEWK